MRTHYCIYLPISQKGSFDLKNMVFANDSYKLVENSKLSKKQKKQCMKIEMKNKNRFTCISVILDLELNLVNIDRNSNSCDQKET